MMDKKTFLGKHPKLLAYLGLIFVVFIWGVNPIISNYLHGKGAENSAGICTAFISLVSALGLFITCIPHLKKFDKSILKVAIPTGIFNSTAAILQRIGLTFSSPTNLAFLENLSCVVVPIILIFLIKKKPNALTIIASILCLLSSIILSGILTNGFGIGIGDAMFALAGIMYGVNIAVTGVYAKKFFAPLYVFIQMVIQTILAFLTAIALNFIKIDGVPIEPIRFVFNIEYILIILACGLVVNALCWVVRTNAMKKVDPTIVAVIMPFSAVVTGLISVISGMDALSLSLVLGAMLGLVAAILSGLGDAKKPKLKNISKKTEK